MNRHAAIRNLSLFIATLLLTAMAPLSTMAAIITGSHVGLLAGDQNSANDGIEISLFDPAASYIKANPNVDSSYSAGTVPLSGIIDYHFYKSGTAAPDLSKSGATYISDALTPSTSIRTNRRNQIDFYTTKSPSGPYDVSQKGIDLDGSGTITGTISLDGLDPSSPVDVYLIGTSWYSDIDVSITSYNEGTTASTLVDLITNPREGNRGRTFLSQVQISDFSDIDQIDFVLEGNEAGIHGVIVTQEVQAAVPEPSTFALAALGLLGLACFGWRKKK